MQALRPLRKPCSVSASHRLAPLRFRVGLCAPLLRAATWFSSLTPPPPSPSPSLLGACPLLPEGDDVSCYLQSLRRPCWALTRLSTASRRCSHSLPVGASLPQAVADSSGRIFTTNFKPTMPSLSVGSKDLSTKLVHAYLRANGGAPEQGLNVENVSVEESAITLGSGETVQGPNTVAVHLAAVYKDAGLLIAGAEEGAEIHQWLSYSAKTEVMQELLKDLDEHLMTRTYLVKEQLTVADLVVFARVYTSFAALSTRQRFTFPALTRWFDLIQHSVPLIPEMPPVDVEVEAPVALAVDRESRLSKKSADKAKKDVSAERAKNATAEGDNIGENKKGEKAEKGAAAGDEKKNTDKKAKKQDAKGAKAEKKKDAKPQEAVPPPPAGAIAGCVPSQLDLRVGRIIECEKHADADSLYVEKIECGEEEPRTVVSGLVKHIPLEEMQGRAVIIMANLKPVAMRGVKSMAMVMCATSVEGKVEILAPPEGSKPGDRVYFEGYEDLLPEPQLNPKKKIFETLAPTLKTDESRRARWIDAEGKSHLMLTNIGVCEAPTAVNALIK